MAKKDELKEGVTAKEVKAIEALLTEPTIQKAAKVAGISYTQLRRWLEKREFAEAYRRARSAMFEATLAGLQSVVSDAITCLHTVMQDKQNPASVRTNAAGKLLEFGFRSRDAMDIETRLAELESRFAEVKTK